MEPPLFHEKNPWRFDFQTDGSRLYVNRETGDTTTIPPFYLVFDTETTGFSPAKDRLVSIAWGIFTRENKNVLLAYHTIKPIDFVINDYSPATKVHGITHSRALTYGVPFSQVVEELDVCIQHVSRIVAHNISFDMRMLGAELGRQATLEAYALKASLEEILPCCTLKKAREQLKGFASKKLEVLYQHFYPGKTFKAHDALEDVKACARCYRKLFKYRDADWCDDTPLEMGKSITDYICTSNNREGELGWANRGQFVYEMRNIGICSEEPSSRMARAWYIQGDGGQGEYAGVWDTVYQEMD